MTRIVALVFVMLGIAIAGGAVYMLQDHLAQQRAMVARKDPGPEMVGVVVAKRRLGYGFRIQGGSLTDNFKWVQWPKEAVPAGVFTSIEELVGTDGEPPRVVIREIEAGEPIMVTKISGFGGSSRVATRVSEGMRAFSIPINVVSGVAGLVTPGDRVDILLTRSIRRELTTSLILQNVLVIAVDQVSNTESDRARIASTATVEVTPTDASKLALAQQVGRLSLTLRGADDFPATDQPLEIGPTQVGDLPDQPTATAAPVSDAPAEVRVRKGGKIETIKVE